MCEEYMYEIMHKMLRNTSLGLEK